MQNGETTVLSETESSSREITRELVESYLNTSTSHKTLSDSDKERFIAIAIAYQLDPFKRELHVCDGTEEGKRKVHFIVGYEVYIKKAARTGLLDGWKAWIEGNGDGMKAIVLIQRKDWANPFTHEVYWQEAVQRHDDGSVQGFWERMPRFQLKKVAISQGFRLCFSEEIGGIPYDFSELPVSTPNTSPAQSRPRTSEKSSPSDVQELVQTIHSLTMNNKTILSTSHMEWIENQLRQEKSEAQLRGLLKHVQESISSGGDQNDQPKQKAVRPSYPRNNKGIKPRLPINNARPTIPQGVPIF